MASRTENSIMNAATSIICQVVTMLCNFIVRIIFIKTLGSDYLGINGLFSSILSILALSELGVGSAIVFSLYKPLAENNKRKIQALMQLYKKTYIVIGTFIFCTGLCLVPFLDRLVNFEQDLPVNYTVCYLLFLSNTAIPYLFFSYRTSIISASQRTYVVKKYEIFFNLGSSLIQLVTLVSLKNFYIYISIPIITSILQNCVTSHKAVQLYPILKSREKVILEKNEKIKILKNIYAMSITRFSTTIYASCDNIIMSVFLGTSVVGLNSNYIMITGMVTTFINLVFNSFTASVGELNVAETSERKLQVFRRIQLITFWVYGFSAVCLAQLMNPFIKLIFGKNYVFSQSIVIAMVLAFLVQGLTRTVLLYKDACGLFWDTRYRALASAIVNLIASWILVQIMGVAGAYIGTIICILTTTFLVDPKIVFKKVFERKSLDFYIWYLKSIVLIVIAYFLVESVNIFIQGGGIVAFIYRCVTSVLITNILFSLVYRKSEEFGYFQEMLLKLVNRIRR